ncbi:putative citrate synthase mitochondrial, partial [Dissostichus eleginoides]
AVDPTHTQQELQIYREEEGTDGMKELTGRREYGAERFVRISLEEMESYYRCTQCCQQLH